MSIVDFQQILLIVLPLLFVACISLNFILGYLVFRSNTRSATNQLFVFVVIALSVWLVLFVLSLYPFTPKISLWLIRWSMFFASLINGLFVFLAYTFPHEQYGMGRRRSLVILLLTLSVALVTISPYTFTQVTIIDHFPHPTPGIGLALFSGFVIMANILTLRKLLYRYRTTTGEEQQRIGIFLAATGLFLGAMLVTVLIPNLVFSVTTTTVLAPLYALGFIVAVAYASFRHQLFDVRVIATETFVVMLSLVLFLNIFSSESRITQFIDTSIFLGTVCLGILLTRAVHKEIRQRDEITKLANELAKTNWELAKKNEQLRIIDQRKSEFVSIVSHQLRTPITAIRGYASLLLENAYGVLPKALIEPIEKISSSSKRLAEMVSDFLDISKIEQGTMVYHFAPVDIHMLLKDLVGEFQQTAAKKKLTLTVHAPQGQTYIALADEGKMRQIFSNILDNAIKYTREGGVTVSLEQNSQSNTLYVRIRDTGIGLTQDDIHHLFGKFTRGEQGQRENTEGSGLGLYIVKKMLEAHQGTIWVDSEGPGKGTVFVIELPNHNHVGTSVQSLPSSS